MICITWEFTVSADESGPIMSAGREELIIRALYTSPTRSKKIPASLVNKRINGQISSLCNGLSGEVLMLIRLSIEGSMSIEISKDSASCSKTSLKSACS